MLQKMTKFISNFKLLLLIKILIFSLFFGNNVYAENINNNDKIIALGKNDAPVIIKVFSSHTCPHCASFHLNVLPEIEKKYIASGKAQVIFMDFPLDQAAFNASKLLHCTNKKNQITFLDKIYEKQNEWTQGSNIEKINDNLKKIVKNLGISEIQFNKCLNNESISDKILNDRIEGQKKYSIESTPTIIINEKKLEGAADFKNISKRIEKII